VLDAETKAPIPQFRITPGLCHNPEMKSWIQWYRTRAVAGSNGSFGFEISLTTGAIVLMAEAEGYLPVTSELLNRGRSKTTIELRKGVGPHGTLVLPDGKAADGVTI